MVLVNSVVVSFNFNEFEFCLNCLDCDFYAFCLIWVVVQVLLGWVGWFGCCR